MAKVDPGRLPASCSQEVGSTHDGPGTGAGSPADQYWSPFSSSPWMGLAFPGPRPPGQEDLDPSPQRVQGPGGLRPGHAGRVLKKLLFGLLGPSAPPWAPLGPGPPWAPPGPSLGPPGSPWAFWAPLSPPGPCWAPGLGPSWASLGLPGPPGPPLGPPGPRWAPLGPPGPAWASWAFLGPPLNPPSPLRPSPCTPWPPPGPPCWPPCSPGPVWASWASWAPPGPPCPLLGRPGLDLSGLGFWAWAPWALAPPLCPAPILSGPV